MSDKTFYRRLAEVQLALKVPKDLKNDYGGYYYRSAEDIEAAAKPLCVEKGLLLIIDDDIAVIEADEIRVYIKSTATVYDMESEKSISVHGLARETLSKKGMDASQVTGTASSYARKYALGGLFLIDNTKDDDTREPTDKPQTAQKRSEGTRNTQPAKTPEIQDDTPSEAYVQEWKAINEKIKTLKDEAISLGVIEDAMKSKITLMLNGKTFHQASVSELLKIQSYIEGLIADQKELKGGNQ